MERGDGKTWYKIVGTGDELPLVTVHGGPGGTHDYLEPLEALAGDRPVVFYDQLGAGQSDKPEDVSDWSNDHLVEELTRLVEVLAFDRVHLLGHSWGTIIAAEYALRRPDRLASLILASACVSVPRYAAAAEVLRAKLPLDVRETLDRHEAAGTTDSPEYQAASMEFYQRHVCRLAPWPDSVVRTFAQLNQAIYERMQGPSEFVINGIHKDYDLTPSLSEIRVPTLFTCGRHDEMRPEDVTYYASLVTGAELAVFDESSHTPHLEEPERYLPVLRDFLHRADSVLIEGSA
jgi:proline iminopeptidase